MAVISFLLAGVENVGVQIEEPHRVLPLNCMCAATLRVLRTMVDDREGAAEVAQLSQSLGEGDLRDVVGFAPLQRRGSGDMAQRLVPSATMMLVRNEHAKLLRSGRIRSSAAAAAAAAAAVAAADMLPMPEGPLVPADADPTLDIKID